MGFAMSSSEILLNHRYRTIYTVDERPEMRLIRCRDEQTNHLVLVALLPTGDATVRDGYLRLAKQVQALAHEGLQSVVDHFVHDDLMAIVCVDPGGQDLERALRARGGPFGEAEILDQLLRVLGVLEYVHSQKPSMYAGDLMASDIWVTDAGSWVLLPFSLVRKVGVSPSPYRAPELANTATEPSAVSDIYSVGALAYRALTGWVPPTAEQISAGTPFNPPRTLNPALSPLIDQAIVRSLLARAQNRYQTAREMRVALHTVRIMENKPAAFALEQPVPPTPVMALAAPPTQPYAPAPVVAAPPPPPPPVYTPPQPEKRGMSIGCIVALAIVGTLIFAVACLAIAILFTPLRGVFGFAPAVPAATAVAVVNPAVSATPQPTSAPLPAPVAIPLEPNAITLGNAQTITATREITTPQFGAVSYSPDGSLLAVGVDTIVSLRDGQSLDAIADLEGHTGRVIAMAWSSDSRTLATGASEDNDIRLWNARTQRLLRTLRGHTGWIRSVAFSPDGKILASGSTDLTIRLWDVQSGQLLRTLQGHTDLVGGVAFSPDGTKLTSASRDGTVRLWDVATGSEVAGFAFSTADSQTQQGAWTTGVAFSPDGGLIAVGATDQVVYLIDAVNGAVVRRLEGHTGWVVIRGVAFAPDGKRLYTGSLDGTIRVWDPITGDQIATYNQHRLDVFGIALNHDGSRLISVSDQEGILYVWDTQTNATTGSLQVGQGLVSSAIFSPNDQILGLAGYNGRFLLRNLTSDTGEQFAGSALAFQPIAFASDTAIVVITNQGEVVLIDQNRPRPLVLAGLEGVPLSVVTNRDGTLIAGAGEGSTVALWDGSKSAPTTTLKTSFSVATLLAFSYDGSLLAVAGPASQPAIEIWDVAKATKVATLEQPTQQLRSVAFQPGTTTLAATSVDGALRFWDATNGTLLREVNALPDQGWYNTIAFSPDGSLAVTGAANGDLQIWDMQTVEQKALFPLGGSILHAAFSNDGAILSVSTTDVKVFIFTLPQ
jgi:WD40 repeat protein